MSSAIAMNLHNLPTDLIRKIIQVGQEHIDFMRTISRRWNILSIEHLSDRKRLPQIKSLMWHTSGRGIIIKMYIPNKRCRFFGVRNWSSLTTSLSESEGCVLVESTGSIDVNALAKLFTRCSSIQNIAFNMDMHHERHINKLVRTAMGDLPIQNLAITGHKIRTRQVCINDNAKSLIWDFLRSYPTPIPRLIVLDNILGTRLPSIDAIFARFGWGEFIEETLRYVPQVQLKSHSASYQEMANAFNATGKFDVSLDLDTFRDGLDIFSSIFLQCRVNIVARKSADQ